MGNHIMGLKKSIWESGKPVSVPIHYFQMKQFWRSVWELMQSRFTTAQQPLLVS